jgi:Uma2 family endonuclease
VSTVARFSVADFDRFVSSGCFEGEHQRRVELIDGEIRQMNALGSRHETVVDRLAEWSFESLPKRKVRVRVQNSIGIPALDSVPEPDVAWVARRDYSRQRPQGRDVLLLMEVAESSLRFDIGKKARLYAKTLIADYWVADVKGQQVFVFRDPQGGEYQSKQIFFRGQETVRPLAFPRVSLQPEALFVIETYDD